jgi:hypothetical protein
MEPVKEPELIVSTTDGRVESTLRSELKTYVKSLYPNIMSIICLIAVHGKGEDESESEDST